MSEVEKIEEEKLVCPLVHARINFACTDSVLWVRGYWLDLLRTAVVSCSRKCYGPCHWCLFLWSCLHGNPTEQHSEFESLMCPEEGVTSRNKNTKFTLYWISQIWMSSMTFEKSLLRQEW